MNEAVYFATEEHRMQEQRFERADRLGLFRQHPAQGPTLLTKVGNQLVSFGEALQTRSGAQREHREAALDGMR